MPVCHDLFQQLLCEDGGTLRTREGPVSDTLARRSLRLATANKGTDGAPPPHSDRIRSVLGSRVLPRCHAAGLTKGAEASKEKASDITNGLLGKPANARWLHGQPSSGRAGFHLQ